MKKLISSIKVKAIVKWPTLGTLKLERLNNKPGNEMWRVGRGYNDNRPFVRIDWGHRAWRWTWHLDYYLAFYKLYSKLSSKDKGECINFLESIEQDILTSPEKYEYDTVTRDGCVVKEVKGKWRSMWLFAKSLK